MPCPPQYRPPIPLLRASLRLRSKEYLRENTLHGVPYFVNPSRPTWERVGWFICIITSLAASLGIIVTLWEKFQTEPTLTGLDTQIEDIPVHFPGVFLCLDWPLLHHSRLNKEQKNHYQLIYEWDWEPLNVTNGIEISDGGYTALFKSLAPSCDTICSHCEFRGISQTCGELFGTVLTPAGVCCSFSTRVINEGDATWRLKFTLSSYPISTHFIVSQKNPMYQYFLIACQRAYVMNSFEIRPLRNGWPFHKFKTAARLTLLMSETYTTSDARILTRSQRECIFEDEGVSLKECVFQCRAAKAIALCGCLPWFYAMASSSGECSLRQYNCLAQNKEVIVNGECGCLLYCHNTVYEKERVSLSTSDSEEFNVSEIRIPVWPSFRYKREVRFGWIDLVVSFGGVAGLFLGYSLLTTVELGYYFTLRSYCGAVLSAPKQKHNIIRVEVVTKKTQMLPKVERFTFYNYVE